MSEPFSVALTGGIGSGKSTVAGFFSELGVPVIDTDIISREIAGSGKPALKKIVDAFGNDVLTEEGVLNRKQLKNIIFSNPEAKTKLEKILHPAIFQEIKKRQSKINYPYCIVVIPLLVETMAISRFDHVLLVDVPVNIQIQRTAKRDDSSNELVINIINSQAKRDERIKYADDIIDNNVKIDDLRKRVNSLHKKYLELSKKNSEKVIN